MKNKNTVLSLAIGTATIFMGTFTHAAIEVRETESRGYKERIEKLERETTQGSIQSSATRIRQSLETLATNLGLRSKTLPTQIELLKALQEEVKVEGLFKGEFSAEGKQPLVLQKVIQRFGEYVATLQAKRASLDPADADTLGLRAELAATFGETAALLQQGSPFSALNDGSTVFGKVANLVGQSLARSIKDKSETGATLYSPAVQLRVVREVLLVATAAKLKNSLFLFDEAALLTAFTEAYLKHDPSIREIKDERERLGAAQKRAKEATDRVIRDC